MPFRIHKIEEFIKWHEREVITIFKMRDQLIANFAVLSGDHSVWMVMLDFRDKNLALRMAKAFCREQNALSCSLATEAWIARGDADDEENVKRIVREGASKQPDRKEVIIISAEIKGKSPSLKTYPINRVGSLVLLGDSDPVKFDRIEGRMMNILGTILN